MKTHTIKTPTAELMIAELPEGCIFNTYKDQIGFCNEINKPITQIKGSYTLLGKPDEIREEDAVELVQSESLNFGNPFYKNFQNEKQPFRTAKESLLSLLESEIYWDVNPIKKPNGEDYYYEENHGFDGVETLWDGGSYNEDLGQFEEAESRTFNRNRSIIFKKKI